MEELCPKQRHSETSCVESKNIYQRCNFEERGLIPDMTNKVAKDNSFETVRTRV